MVAVLAVFFQVTRVGRALRAVADDHQAAQSVGIPLNQIWLMVWAVSGIVALVAGMMWGAKLGVQFSISLVALKALPVLILGGFTSIPGAIVGGLIIGAGEKLAEVLLAPGADPLRSTSPAAASRTGSPTCWRCCSCCSGRRACSANASSSGCDAVLYREAGQFKTSYAADQAIFPIAQDRWFVIGCSWRSPSSVVPLFAGQYLYTEVLIPVLILSLAAIGLNILTGYCGQLSLGTGGFMAVGAYAAYNLALRLPETNIILVFLFGGVMAMLVGMLFGLPSLRIKGFYLAVATLAAQFFLEWAFARVKWFTNYAPSGSVAVGQLELFGIPIDTPGKTYLFVLAIVVVLALAAKNLVRGRIGRMWMAMRDMDIAAEIIGIRPLHAKLSAFAVSSFYIGVAGALWAFLRLGSWEPLAFDINRSFQVLFMIIIGGLGIDPRLVPRRRLHRADADLPQPAAGLARHPDLDRA